MRSEFYAGGQGHLCTPIYPTKARIRRRSIGVEDHIRNIQRTKIDYLNSLQNPALDPVYNARQSRYVLARNF